MNVSKRSEESHNLPMPTFLPGKIVEEIYVIIISPQLPFSTPIA